MKNRFDILAQLPKTCRIIAVSKLQPTAKIRELYLEGQHSFAENYVQEAKQKQNELQDLKIEWHFIGKLQKNKIKDVAGKFSYLHSIESLELAEQINKKMQNLNLKQKVFLQLNLADEETKNGFTERQFHEQLEKISQLPNLEICGLMTMPPLFEDPELARPYFKKLRVLRDQYQSKYPNLAELSMGTSSDFLVAAQEGASMIRLGTILFGERISTPRT